MQQPRKVLMNKSMHTPPKHSGLSLAELLVAIFIGAMIFIAASQLLVTHIRTNSRMEAMMRLRDNWGRLQFLLEQEIQESRGAATSSGSLSLTIPNPSIPSSTTSITYTLTGNALTRTGPPINSDGSLNFTLSSNTETILRGITGFTVSIGSDSSQTVIYTADLVDPTGVGLNQRGSAATAESRIIN